MKKNIIFKCIVSFLLVLISAVAFVACSPDQKFTIVINFMVDGELYRTATLTEDTVPDMPADPTKEGFIFEGWYIDEGATGFTMDSLSAVEEDTTITVYAVWRAVVPKYTVNFNPNGGTLQSGALSQEIDQGGAAVAPVLERVGYNFVSWDKTFDNITGNITVSASWSKKTYTVTFDGDGGSRVSGGTLTQTIEHGEAATAPVFLKNYYTFIGWNNTFNNITGITTVKALWRIDTYTVTFNPNGGTLQSGALSQEIDREGSAVAPVLERVGYNFVSWDKTFDNITGNITVSANWSKKIYAVTFVPGEGTHISGELVQSVEYRNAAIPPALAREGYRYTWDKEFSIITSDTTITAVWEELDTVEAYTVTFVVDPSYHISGELVQIVERGKSAVPPACMLGGYLLSWDKDYHNVTGTLTINAVWTKKAPEATTYTVVFDGNGGTFISGALTQEVEEGRSAIPPLFAKTGFTLSWDEDYSEINEDITITAQWTAKAPELHTVIFVCEQGNYVSGSVTQEVEDEGSAIPPLYEREGYTLSWDKAYTNVRADLTVIAIWVENVYTVVFDPAGGELESGNLTQNIRYGQAAEAPALEKEGYEFKGWDKLFEDITEDTIITAIWEIIIAPLNVTLNPKGGTISQTSVTVEYAQLYTFPKPELEGYIFAGWFDEENGEGKKYVSRGVWDLAYGPTLYAHWLSIVTTDHGIVVPEYTELDPEDVEEILLSEDDIDVLKGVYMAFILAYYPDNTGDDYADLQDMLLGEFEEDSMRMIVQMLGSFGITQDDVDFLIGILDEATEWLEATVGEESMLPEGFGDDLEMLNANIMNLLIIPEELEKVQQLLIDITSVISPEIIGAAVNMMVQMMFAESDDSGSGFTYDLLLEIAEGRELTEVLALLTSQGDIAQGNAEGLPAELLTYNNLCYIGEFLLDNITTLATFDTENLAKLMKFILLATSVEDFGELIAEDGPIAIKDLIEAINIVGDLILEIEITSQDYLYAFSDLLVPFLAQNMGVDSEENGLEDLLESVKDTYPISIALKLVGIILRDLTQEDFSSIYVDIEAMFMGEEEEEEGPDPSLVASIIVKASKILMNAFNQLDSEEQARIINLIPIIESLFFDSKYVFASTHANFNVFSKLENYATYDLENITDEQINEIMNYISSLFNLPYAEMETWMDIMFLETGCSIEDFLFYLDDYIIVGYIDYSYDEETGGYSNIQGYSEQIDITEENVLNWDSSTDGLCTITIRIDNSQILDRYDYNLPIRTFDVEVQIFFFDPDTPISAEGYYQSGNYTFNTDDEDSEILDNLYKTYVTFGGIEFNLDEAESVELFGIDTETEGEHRVGFAIAYFAFGKVAFPIYYDVTNYHRSFYINFYAGYGGNVKDEYDYWDVLDAYTYGATIDPYDFPAGFFESWEGYTMVGWAWDYLGEDLIIEPFKMPKEDLEIFLIWSLKNEVYFHYNHEDADFEYETWSSWYEYFEFEEMPSEGDSLDVGGMSNVFTIWGENELGCEFLGWAFDQEGNDLIIDDTIEIVKEGVHLYAMWRPLPE